MSLINCGVRLLRSHKSQLIMIVVVGWLGVPSAAMAAPVGPSPLFHLTDPRLDEISGIAAGITSPGVVYVENDSGDSARFFALDKSSGALLATYTVPGATNVDWEDIAVAPDAGGTPSVWLADIGDNDAVRKQIEIYRVDEPNVDTGRRGATLTSAAPQVWRLKYPDGSHDAESLAVSPAGVPYLVSKSYLGASTVYVAPARPHGMQTLRRVGSAGFGLGGAATGADISRDGTRLVVRTYTDAYFWTVRGGDVAAALRAEPQRIALPSQPQGEGICFDGSRVLIDSEGVGSAVYAVRPPTAASSPASASRPAPATSAPSTPGPSQAAGTQPRRTPANHRLRDAWWVLGAALVVVIGGAAMLHRRRSGQDRRA